MAHGKRYQDAVKLVDRDRVYSLEEAVGLARETSNTKFDASVEAHLRLGVDPRHADQMVRGTVVLPHGTGTVEVCEGGLEVANDAGGASVIANAAAVVKLDLPRGR